MRTLQSMSGLFIIALLLSAPSFAELYKWTDENGEIIYSDEPPPQGAETIDPPPITTTPPVRYQPKPAAVKKNAPADEKTPPATSYSSLKITSPGNDEAVRNNPGNVTVSFAMEPPLDTASGHSISLLVDGKVAQSDIRGNSVTIPHMDRGTHRLKAEIRDKNGTILKASEAIEFHLLRHSKLHP